MVMMEMTDAKRLVFSLTRVEAASDTTTYDTGAHDKL